MFVKIMELFYRLFRFDPDYDILDDIDDRECGSVIGFIKPGARLDRKMETPSKNER